MAYKGSGLVDHVYFHSKKVCIDLENTLMHNAQSRQLASTSHQSRQTVIRHHITNAVMYLPHTTMYHKPRARRRGHTGIQDSEEVRDPPRTGASAPANSPEIAPLILSCLLLQIINRIRNSSYITLQHSHDQGEKYKNSLGYLQ